MFIKAFIAGTKPKLTNERLCVEEEDMGIRVFGVGSNPLHQQREPCGFDELGLGALRARLLGRALLQLLLGQIAERGQVPSLQGLCAQKLGSSAVRCCCVQHMRTRQSQPSAVCCCCLQNTHTKLELSAM